MGGGGKGGKGGGGSSINVQPSPYEQSMANIANQYYSQTEPLRLNFLQDFGSFLRPGQSTYGGGTGAGIGTGTGAGTSPTPLSANFNVPSAEEISKNLNLAYSGSDQAMGYLKNLGYNMPGYRSYTDTPGFGTPEWDPWVANKANELRTSALTNAMQPNAGQTPAGQAGAAGGTTSPFTSSALYNPYNLPGYAPLYQLSRTGLESQYGQARGNILSSLPRGGALAESLANLEMGRAQQAGALPATIAAPLIQDIYNKAYGVAFGAPQTTLSGLSGAASAYGTREGIGASSAMQQAALGQQSGMAGAAGLGSLVGLGVKAAMK